MRNPCYRQLISIHVRLQFFDSGLKRFFAKHGTPLLKEPLRQLRKVLWKINQVADLNAAHISCNVRPNEKKLDLHWSSLNVDSNCDCRISHRMSVMRIRLAFWKKVPYARAHSASFG